MKEKAPPRPSDWPPSADYRERCFVPDLKIESPRIVFVAESPHRDEIMGPVTARCPFRGMAGRAWWGEVSKAAGLEKPEFEKGPLDKGRLEELCRRLCISVVNAVNYPLGNVGDPESNLGLSQKILNRRFDPDDANVRKAVSSLSRRLAGRAPVVPLGAIAEKLVVMALKDEPHRIMARITHPSSWWRNREWKLNAGRRLASLIKTYGG